MSTAAIPPLVALSSKLTNNEISPSELSEVAAALQTQLINQFVPTWHAGATVQAAPDPNNLPRGVWPIFIQEALDDPGALGYHEDAHRQPFALVMYTDDWATTVSHELLEMLADPWGRRLVTCVDPRGAVYGKARVLVEVCDPCEAFTYQVNGIAMSDFVEPSYYGSHHWGYGIKDTTPKASYLGTVNPLQVARGGYLSWEGADGRWYQRTFFGGSAPSDKDISDRLDEALNENPMMSLRSAIDRITSEARDYVAAESVSVVDNA